MLQGNTIQIKQDKRKTIIITINVLAVDVYDNGEIVIYKDDGSAAHLSNIYAEKEKQHAHPNRHH